MLGSEKEFVVTEAWTHGPGHGAVYQCLEPSVIPLSYPGAPTLTAKISFDKKHSERFSLPRGIGKPNWTFLKSEIFRLEALGALANQVSLGLNGCGFRC